MGVTIGAVTVMGPTIRRRQLGADLQRLRRDAGVSAQEVAELLDCNISRVSHLETGRNPIRKVELAVLLGRFGASDEQRVALEELRQDAAKRGWWSSYRLPSTLQTYVGLESSATMIRAFEGELIPGLLQTESYARRLHSIAPFSTPPDEVDRHVGARLRRAERLRSETPPDYAAVVSEAAFRRAVEDSAAGGDDTIRHMLDLVAGPVVTVYVLPFSTGLHPSMSGRFTVLGFDDPTIPGVGYQEYAFGGHLVDEPDVVARLTALWDTLREQAWGADESVEWMTNLVASKGTRHA